MSFNNPWALALLVLLPVIVWRWVAMRNASAIRFSSTRVFNEITPSLKLRLRWVLPLLRIGAIGLLIVCLAQPRQGRKQTSIDTEGIAIQMLVDRSGSMQAMDFQLQGQPVDRLAAVKDVAGRFVAGADGLEGRGNDLVSLITFARYADSVCPLTLDHAYLVHSLEQAQIVTQRSEDGTAIGDAIGLAVERLNALEASRRHSGTPPVKSKVVILLTDGESNAGLVDPVQAAELAATQGVKIYTIGVGTKGRAPMPMTDPFTGRTVMQWVRVNIDEAALGRIAQLTGGRYFRATDTASLESIYKEIDQLEKTRIEEKHYVDYKHWAVEPIHAGRWTLPPLLLVAFVVLAAQALLAHTLFRRVP